MIQFRLISNYLSELDTRLKEWRTSYPVLAAPEKKEDLVVLRRIPSGWTPFKLKKQDRKTSPKSSH